MKGIIVVNAFDCGKNVMYKANRMSDSFSRRGVQTKIVPNDRFLAVVGEGGKVGLNTDADFAVYLDKDKYVQYLLEKAGIFVFNSARSTELCDDKMMTHIALVNHGIDMPMTLGGALCYSGESQLKEEYLKYIADTLGLPLVVKSCYGSYGQQVHLAENYSTLKEIASRLKNSATLFQRYVKESHGKDMRVIVVGGKAVAWMTRRSEIGFRSNVEAGGKGYVCDLPDSFRRIAEKSAEILQLDFCGADILFGKDGPLLCEVNSNAMIGEAERVTGVDIADCYVNHILNKLNYGAGGRH